jgi:acetyl esterase/lipase
MDRDDILGRAAPAPDQVLRYGDGAEQVADFWYPAEGRGGAALIVFLHGGFWRAAYDRVHARPLAVALAAAGYAVVLPEYRRTGQAGGGWPGTFDDVALAADALPGLVRAAAEEGIRPGEGMPTVLAGHSAGGHLALWAASRGRLSAGSAWAGPGRAVPAVAGVVGLAAVSDLTACAREDLGRGAAQALMGGGPDRWPDRYAQADPARLLPGPAPVRLVHGENDSIVPSQMSAAFARQAAAAGGLASCDLLPGCGHFEVIDPQSAAWPAVLAAFQAAAAPAPPPPAPAHPGV